MTDASITVAVDGGPHVTSRVPLVADLAHRLGAWLGGVSACMPDCPRGYGETAVPAGMVIQENRQVALTKLAGVELVLRNTSCLNEHVEWRSDLGDPVRFLEGQVRIADHVVPLLRRAESVQMLQVADDGDRTESEDVGRYLTLHDVKAEGRQAAASGWTVAEVLQKAAVVADADLIVSGGYGHSRLREWFVGEVTREFLAEASVCGLMRH